MFGLFRKNKIPEEWRPERMYPSSQILSDWINQKLDEGHEPVRLNRHKIQFAGKQFWGGNYPYAWFHPYPDGKNDVEWLPDVETCLRLSKIMDESVQKNKEKELLEFLQEHKEEETE